jgi:hypothetical protein
MTTFLQKLPLWVNIAALIISAPLVIGSAVEAATPFQIRVRRRKVSVKYRVGALSILAAFLTVMVAAATGLPSPNPYRSRHAHVTFVEPAQPPDGGPALVSCHASVILHGSVPPGDVIALASSQIGRTVLYFESAVVPGPRKDEWSGSVTLGNASSVNVQFTMYVIIMPKQWESYLVKSVNWAPMRSGDTDWAESSLPPDSWTATSVIVQQKSSTC